jgi:hypothetical protein
MRRALRHQTSFLRVNPHSVTVMFQGPWRNAIVFSSPYTIVYHEKLETMSQLPASNLLRRAKRPGWVLGGVAQALAALVREQ